MNSHGSTQGEGAVAHLQRASSDGLPVLIPGAREVRLSRQPGPTVAAPRMNLRPEIIDVADPARLDRQREGGGAPSERSDVRQPTMLAWLERWFGRGIDVLRSAPGPQPGNERT